MEPTKRWIEVEPGSPLPPEMPPWAVRYALVKRAGLPDSVQRAMQKAGVALLAGSLAVALLVGSGAGSAGLYAAFGAIVGLVLLFAGLIGVPPSEEYVPSPGGRLVAVRTAAEPLEPAGTARPRTSGRRAAAFVAGGGAAVIGAILLLEYLQGDLTLHGILMMLPMLVSLLPLLLEWVAGVVERRLKSEAEVSERFLEAADPRVPLAALAEAAPVTPSAPSAKRGSSLTPPST